MPRVFIAPAILHEMPGNTSTCGMGRQGSMQNFGENSSSTSDALDHPSSQHDMASNGMPHIAPQWQKTSSPAAARRQCRQQAVVGLDELEHPLLLQLLRHLLQIDAESRQRRHQRLRRRFILIDANGRLAMVAVGGQGRRRQGVDGLRANQRLDIFDVGIGRILGRGGGPQQPLWLRTGGGQPLPAGEFRHCW